jgi:hypothetical protein
VSPNFSFKSSGPPKFGLGELWAKAKEETTNAPAKLTMQH